MQDIISCLSSSPIEIQPVLYYSQFWPYWGSFSSFQSVFIIHLSSTGISFASAAALHPLNYWRERRGGELSWTCDWQLWKWHASMHRHAHNMLTHIKRHSFFSHSLLCCPFFVLFCFSWGIISLLWNKCRFCPPPPPLPLPSFSSGPLPTCIHCVTSVSGHAQSSSSISDVYPAFIAVSCSIIGTFCFLLSHLGSTLCLLLPDLPLSEHCVSHHTLCDPNLLWPTCIECEVFGLSSSKALFQNIDWECRKQLVNNPCCPVAVSACHMTNCWHQGLSKSGQFVPAKTWFMCTKIHFKKPLLEF